MSAFVCIVDAIQLKADLSLLVAGKFEERIVIVRDAISDRRGMVSLITTRDNQGAVRVKDACKLNASHCISIVYMDDLTDVATRQTRSRRAVIKVCRDRECRFTAAICANDCVWGLFHKFLFKNIIPRNTLLKKNVDTSRLIL